MIFLLKFYFMLKMKKILYSVWYILYKCFFSVASVNNTYVLNDGIATGYPKFFPAVKRITCTLFIIHERIPCKRGNTVLFFFLIFYSKYYYWYFFGIIHQFDASVDFFTLLRNIQNLQVRNAIDVKFLIMFC